MVKMKKKKKKKVKQWSNVAGPFRPKLAHSFWTVHRQMDGYKHVGFV
jgi:hypothetical protein